MNICETFLKDSQNCATELIRGQPPSVSYLNAGFALLSKRPLNSLHLLSELFPLGRQELNL